MHRLASNDVQVMAVDAQELVARPILACAGLSCLRTDADVAVVVQPDGALWAAWSGDATARGGRVVSDAAGAAVDTVPAPVQAFVDVVRMRGVTLAADDAGAAGKADVAPLPADHRTCGTTNAGGGFAYHVIKNDGDVWQRLQWTRPPTNDDVKALSDNAYPIVIGAAGTLCAWAVQKTPRNWEVHSPSGVVVAAAPDREHPPAHCISADLVAVDVGDHAVHVSRDGSKVDKELPSRSVDKAAPAYDPVMPLGGAASSNNPTGTLRIADTSFARPLVDSADLAGKALPAGAHRRRIASAGDGARFVVVTEKIEQADCTTRELVHVVDTQGQGAVTTVRDADVVIAKVSAAAGRFWWLEATPQLVDVGN